MTIVFVGGGSGGHITPLQALAVEIKRREPSARIVCIIQKGDRFGGRLSDDPNIDQVAAINAGKFRRYHGSWASTLSPKTLALNARDLVRFVSGTWQSWWLLRRLNPDVIFIKGGFVGVPVGIAASVRKIPFVTHDSDTTPGLANRIVGRWATINAVGFSAGEYKSYASGKVVVTGIPLRSEYKKIDANEKKLARETLGLQKFRQIILLTGGGLGADNLNRVMIALAPKLLTDFPDLAIVHQAGEKLASKVAASYKTKLTEAEISRIIVVGFSSNMYNYSAAADVIITRAGATTLAELAVQHKACVVVPNDSLAGGHQTTNAKILAAQGTVSLVTESEKLASELEIAVRELLANGAKASELADMLSKTAPSDAAKKLADILLEISGKDKTVIHSSL